MPRMRRLNARFQNQSNRVKPIDIRKQDASPRYCCWLSFPVWLVLVISGSILFGYLRWSNAVQPGMVPPVAAKEKDKSSSALDTSSLQNCTISFVPPPARPENEWRKPLWIPSFPSSGSASASNKGDIVKDLVEKLFGKQGAVKNYHVSMKNRLRRCKGVSETVGCSQGHPYVPIGPEKQTMNFQSNVIFVVRNFMTAFPAEHTDKGIAYHGNKGQAPEDGWRDVRDKYVESSMKAWTDVLQWWNSAEYYKVAAYIPYERLLNPETGPAVVQKLADTLTESGFEVAPKEDIPCIWYQVTSKEIARQKALQEYTPGFTPDQRKFLLSELNSLIHSFSSQPEKEDLVSILEGYREEVQFKIRIDKPAADNAAA